MKNLAALAALTLITAPVQASPVFAFDKAIGLMYYHSRLPNQAGTCDYASDAMKAAIQLWDQQKIQEVKKMQDRFGC